METELRRKRIELLTLGAGVIAFGVWTVVKFILYLWVTPFDLSELDIDPQMKPVAVALVYAFVVLILAFLQSLRLYVGLSARAEGRGTKRGNAYIVLAALMLVFNVIWFVYLFFDFWGGKMEHQSKLDYITSTAVDFTSLLTLADLLYTALRVRKLSYELEG